MRIAIRSGVSSMLLAAGLLAGPAQAQIYKCEGSDGVVEYSNSPASAQGNRRCTVVQLNPITTIPSPKLPARATQGAGGAQPAGTASGAAGASAAAKPAGSENFPKVDTATQKARDTDRRRILEDELKKEEDKLAELRKEYNNGEPERLGDERNYQKYLDRVQRLKDDIGRSEANIASLRRELAALRI
ncbi:MAG TPA: DUF4124 domain-containing protein [Quisquiliibacterium sp.]|nr:DUF4124 domain-containing protein [Quisquiliibacterium sp.]